MAYQFIHFEGYGRTAGKDKAGAHTVASIAAEAERAKGACPHVATPEAPTPLYGCSPSEAAALAAAWADSAKDARGHQLRKDALCLLGGVVSLPPGTPKEEWVSYRNDTLKWLKKEYHKRLASVIEHTDEAAPHLHFYAVPLPQDTRFDVLHPGIRASSAANPTRGKRDLSDNEKKKDRKAAKIAYAEAMRRFQDQFFAAVSKKHGLVRIGPRKRRLTRTEWHAEQQAAQTRSAHEAELAAREYKLLMRESEFEKTWDELQIDMIAFSRKKEELEENAKLAGKFEKLVRENLYDLSQENRNKVWKVFKAVATGLHEGTIDVDAHGQIHSVTKTTTIDLDNTKGKRNER
jgi:hypothetical protein